MIGRVRTSALIVGILLIGVPSARAGATASDGFSHLRPLDERAKQVLGEAVDASFTVQELARHLELSDVVVYVRIALLPGELAGTTTMQAVTPTVRYLVVTVDPRAIPIDVLARLGHELQHAVEIADSPEVRDGDAMRRLFQKIGWRSGGRDRWETGEAVAAGRHVLLECWAHPIRLGDVARADGTEKPAAR